MNISEYINELLIAGSGVGTTLLAWKQGQKQAKGTHLDNVEKAIQIWENTSTKLHASLTDLEQDMALMKRNYEDCEKGKKELSDKVCSLEMTMHELIGTPKNIRKTSVRRKPK